MLETMYGDRRTCARLREGPLGAYVDEFVARERAAGFARLTIHDHLRAVGALNAWLAWRGLAAHELTAEHLESFVRHRRRTRRPKRDGRDVLDRLLEQLRAAGVAPAAKVRRSTRPVDRLLDEFARYLVQVRGLAASTVVRYRPFVQRFLEARFGAGALRLSRLRPTDLRAAVLRMARCGSRGQARELVVALRAFLRWLQLRGDIDTRVAAAVPSVTTWRLRGVPAVLTPIQVRRMLQTCDRRTAMGRRDYAILLLLVRLGLRAGALVALRLDDVDWRGGQLTVRHKGGVCDRLPLLPRVGAALAAYVQRGRPRCALRTLFLCMNAPYRGLGHSSTVSSIATAALRRAGLALSRRGAHLLRHTLASSLLRHGAPLHEIGQVLGHRSLASTEVYAKVDLAGLRALAQPWPGGAR